MEGRGGPLGLGILRGGGGDSAGWIEEKIQKGVQKWANDMKEWITPKFTEITSTQKQIRDELKELRKEIRDLKKNMDKKGKK